MVDKLMQARFAETRVVSGMYLADRQLSQSLHGAGVSAFVDALDLVQQWAIVYGIAREERSGGLFPETNAARRVAGQVENLKGAVAQVQSFPFIN
jgi:hypothetical protein